MRNSPRYVRSGWALLALPALFAFGCNGAGEIIASDYDQSCEAASDCVPINTGPIQCCDSCPGDAAINKKDLRREQADVEAGSPDCEGQVCPLFACMEVNVGCVKNKCVIVNPG